MSMSENDAMALEVENASNAIMNALMGRNLNVAIMALLLVADSTARLEGSRGISLFNKTVGDLIIARREAA